MGRGGKRPGAGRPRGSGKYGEPTKAVRLPMSLVTQVTKILENWPSQGRLCAGDIQIQRLSQQETTPTLTLPLYLEAVAAGYPTPATDYVDGELDLNQHLTQHPEETFCVRVNGDSMIDAGIHPNDLLIVDRAIEPKNGSVVIAVVDGEVTVKRMYQDDDRLLLVPENDRYKPLEIAEETQFHIWGVVTNVVHAL
ncbi:translesion error-prone DNA polymerase V autoproteolytic subunit [Oscillatoriales cyanobacterium LEGE 11467]|uniref:Translesion error-prone DNA polymerase V autoproteolytic subunit n=1 Tax=Zarconia navalis LEGE 11467 TaxID=1828826 RepID=A0A928VV70_9CYAN|nr:translesion error-prone DNA polymerase V autoproteolytic subunit [Zarconia navalis]MBE9040109.1 translesion error-prone DNA polymerase V autoproteolytic subunit [Zarconia navalis LEGE 11467]